jgi:hypothetical protein
MLAAAVLALAVPAALNAQNILGPWDDAWHLPPGVARFGVAAKFLSATERFGLTGTREPLGAPFSGTLNAGLFPTLSSLETSIAALSGDPTVRVSLGTARTGVQRSGGVVPFQLSLGIHRRVSLHALVPFFTSEQDGQLILDPTDATVGANPALLGSGSLAANTALVTGFRDAALDLESRADACVANPASSPDCAMLVAELTAVRALIARSRTVSDAIAIVYGGHEGLPPSLFVPLEGSATQTTIANLVASLRTDLLRYGTTSVAAGAAPVAAGAPATLSQITQLLTDTTYGYALVPVKRRYRQGVGDIDLGVSLLLYDGLNANPWTPGVVTKRSFRQSVGITYRLGTGSPADPDDPLQLATGDGQTDLELTSATDVVANKHFWGSLIVRFTKQNAFEGITRIPDGSGSPFIPLARRRMARTELGTRLSIDAAPRWALNDQFAAGVLWRYSRAGESTVTELAPFTDGIPLQFRAPSMSAHELGIGFVWSSIARWRGGRTRWPLEIQWDRSMVVAATGGVTRLVTDRFSVRAYASLWGR